MTKPYKYEIILDYLKQHKRITSMQIINLAQTCYPQTILAQIRAKGYKIESEPSGHIWDIYVLKDEPKFDEKGQGILI